MFNCNLTIEYLSIKEVAEYTDTNINTLKKRCIRGAYTTRKVPAGGGRKGLKYEILVSSLEQELQEKISVNLNSTGRKAPQNRVIDAPFSLNNNPILANRASVLDALNNPASSMQNVITEDARRIALAKFNTVQYWLDYRKDKKNKKQADEEFTLGFNAGIISTEMKNLIGNVSISSLYRWKKSLQDANNNYYSLINNYKYTHELELNTTLTDEEKQEFVKIYFNDSKINVGVAYNLIKYNFERRGLKVKSESTYRRFVKYIETYHKDFAVLSREGEKALNDKVGLYLHRDTSDLSVGYALVADGNKLDFAVLNPFTGRPVRAMLVLYLDWYSYDVAGYDIMLSENTQCISSALRNSILRMGKIPKYVYMDNGKAFRGKYFTGSNSLYDCNFLGVYKSLGIETIIANAYSGRSKVVERFFRNFVQSCPPFVPSYIGNCIDNKPAHLKRNESFHKELHKNDIIPNIEQAKSIIEAWLEFYRSKQCPNCKNKTIGEVFKEGIGAGINEELLNELLMANEIRTVKRNVIRLNGLEYSSADLYGISDKVLVKYSLLDLTKIKVYTLKGAYLCDVPLITKVKAIVRDGSAVDLYNYRMQIKQQKMLTEQTKRKTKLLIGNGVPFENCDWTIMPQIENKSDSPKEHLTNDLFITNYEDLQLTTLDTEEKKDYFA